MQLLHKDRLYISKESKYCLKKTVNFLCVAITKIHIKQWSYRFLSSTKTNYVYNVIIYKWNNCNCVSYLVGLVIGVASCVTLVRFRTHDACKQYLNSSILDRECKIIRSCSILEIITRNYWTIFLLWINETNSQIFFRDFIIIIGPFFKWCPKAYSNAPFLIFE